MTSIQPKQIPHETGKISPCKSSPLFYFEFLFLFFFSSQALSRGIDFSRIEEREKCCDVLFNLLQKIFLKNRESGKCPHQVSLPIGLPSRRYDEEEKKINLFSNQASPRNESYLGTHYEACSMQRAACSMQHEGVWQAYGSP